jgi:adenosylmethionine---8-amino-7-oxononanoate aminotransferase
MSASGDLVSRDARVVWHPYTQHATEPAPLPVASARGARLVLTDGRELVDAISSWWTSLHGHGEARLVAAMERQARTLDHVLFAGATHEPAVALAERLARVVPVPSPRVFFSDDGSTAVEVALKIALQSAWQTGRREARTFIALEGGYHGDTFGAMSVGDPDPWFRPFAGHLFDVRRVALDVAAV